jgi:hypothetical protein
MEKSRVEGGEGRYMGRGGVDILGALISGQEFSRITLDNEK